LSLNQASLRQFIDFGNIPGSIGCWHHKIGTLGYRRQLGEPALRVYEQDKMTEIDPRREALRIAFEEMKSGKPSSLPDREFKPDAEQDNRKKFGKVMVSKSIGMTTITVFEKGYVSIGGKSGSVPSKLLGISSNLNTKKKNVVGRGLGAALTGGGSLLFNSGNKGAAVLTIVTAAGNKVISRNSPRTGEIEAILELEAVGLAVIELSAQSDSTVATQATGQTAGISVSGEIEKLHSLHMSGALTDEEFASAKKKLLS
jgi:hypothetical protein